MVKNLTELRFLSPKLLSFHSKQPKGLTISYLKNPLFWALSHFFEKLVGDV